MDNPANRFVSSLLIRFGIQSPTQQGDGFGNVAFSTFGPLESRPPRPRFQTASQQNSGSTFTGCGDLKKNLKNQKQWIVLNHWLSCG